MSPRMLSDTESVKSTEHLLPGKHNFDRRLSLGLQRPVGPSSLQLAARTIQRQNSGKTVGNGYQRGDHNFDLGIHVGTNSTGGMQDVGFFSVEDNANSQDGASQTSDSKQKQRAETQQKKSLFFKRLKEQGKGGNSSLMMGDQYRRASFARGAGQMEGVTGQYLDQRSNQDPLEHELVQSKSSDSNFEGDNEDNDDQKGTGGASVGNSTPLSATKRVPIQIVPQPQPLQTPQQFQQFNPQLQANIILQQQQLQKQQMMMQIYMANMQSAQTQPY
ncbi:hypothetical protein FGO68_gene11230 [Halteria grandinella]|uniref:Uncharacterized protein n=1 Tax=Halteria grandinella TaxID=5974 RepID=A0A8J8T8Z0_HALGN|nr:hypothetical protein FGO68_gene11230 [Halteria grandinella]